jgi:ATP-dependent Clp protease ATP-binding subunit ClpA
MKTQNSPKGESATSASFMGRIRSNQQKLAAALKSHYDFIVCGSRPAESAAFYSEHFVSQIPQRRENHTHLPYRRQRSVIEMKARTVFQRLEVVMTSVAPAPCMALEPDRRSADIQSFESELRRRIVGQDHAIDSLVSAFQGVRAGLVPERRPIRNFLFLGTGES